MDGEELVITYGEHEITSWLLRGFSRSNFSPVYFPSEPDVTIQLQWLFDSLDANNQEKMKLATLRAIAEWILEVHGVNVLRQLIFLSAYIRASRVTEYLRIIIETDEIDRIDEKSHMDLVSDILAVIAGFSPLPEVYDLFYRLYFSDKFDHRFATQLFLGLCECEPENYPKYIPRLFYFFDKFEDDYRLDIVISEFVRIVSLPRIADNLVNLKKIDIQSYYKLVEYLCSYAWSPAALSFSDEENLPLIRLRHSPSIDVSFPIITHNYYFESNQLFEVKNKEIDLMGIDKKCDELLELIPC